MRLGTYLLEVKLPKYSSKLIDLRYEKKSTIFTTNINFNLKNKIFDDPKIANAILDRILHHSSVVKITGKSYRLKNHSPKKKIT